jgi:murein DD-endopeptidase MepM/ murein hydrolase activator NlpD
VIAAPPTLARAIDIFVAAYMMPAPAKPLIGARRKRAASTAARGLLVALLLSPTAPTFSPSRAAAKEACAVGMGIVCFDAVQGGNTVTISAQNRETYEVTITVKAKLKNMTSSVGLPYTRVLDGGFRGVIMTFQAGARGGWEWQYSWAWTPGSVNARHDDSVVYDLPYRGVRMVMQGFHGKFTHTGNDEYAVDFDMPVGTALYAAREGVVVGTRADMKLGGAEEQYRNKANFILIRHADGTFGTYDHLREGGVAVKVGTQVGRGQLIGYSGSTGFSSGPHLHFAIYRANDGYGRETFPMRFRTAAGIISPVQGQSYRSVQ